MFGPTLDTAMGLVLILLLFSILLTIVMEIIAAAGNLRAKALEDMIARLIKGPTVQASAFAWLGAHKTQSVKGLQNAAGAVTFARVFNHPQVGGANRKGAPSYVPAANFWAALLQQLVGQGGGGLAQIDTAVAALPPSSLKTALQSLLAQAAGDITKFKAGIET